METLKTYFKNNIRQYAMVIALVAIMALFQITTSGIMFKPMNITNLVLQNAYVLILAVGMLLVIVSGNIDLSVGSLVAFIGAVSAVLMVDLKMPVLPAILVSLAIGASVGAFQGFFIAFLKIPAFIVTLAGMLIFRGFTMVILKGQTKAPFAKSFQAIAAGYLPGRELRFHGLAVVTLVLGAVFALAFVALAIQARRIKKKHSFKVPSAWIETPKIVLLTSAILFLTWILARYNGIPVILLFLV